MPFATSQRRWRQSVQATGWLGVLLVWSALVQAQPLAWPGEGVLDALLYPAADPFRPETWALLSFAPEMRGPITGVDEGRELAVPLGRLRVKVDGRVTPDEWCDARTGVWRYGPGSQLAVMLKRVSGQLAVGVAAPAELRVRPGTLLEVGWDSPRSGSQPLETSHRLLRVTLARDGRSHLELLSGCDGEWTPDAGVERVSGLRAALGNGGDGAWAYLAGEVLIPLSRMATGDGALPQSVGLFVRVLPGLRRRALPMRPSPLRESVFWPDCRSSPAVGNASVLPERPDLWQRVTLDAGRRTAPVIPQLGAPVKLDGQVRDDEWLGAAESRYELPGGQWRRVCYGQDGGMLYVGVAWCMARGLRGREECRLYLDPLADGGLKPRADDLTVVVSAERPQAASVLQYVAGLWTERPDDGITGVMAQADGFESHCEFAVPLPAIAGADGQAGLAVGVSWDTPAS